MKVTKDQAAANKEAILTAASRLYREKGIDGIGIQEIGRITRETGKCYLLEHGGRKELPPGGFDHFAT